MDDLNPLAGTAHLLEEVDSKYRTRVRSVLQQRLNFQVFRLLEMGYSQLMLLLFAEKLMVLLRDGRTLIGYLRSVDQFANLVLHKTIERIHVGKEYGDIPRGIFIIRGENVVLLGEIVSVTVRLELCTPCGVDWTPPAPGHLCGTLLIWRGSTIQSVEFN